MRPITLWPTPTIRSEKQSLNDKYRGIVPSLPHPYHQPPAHSLTLTSWNSWDISHTRQELDCISHLCLSDRKKSRSSGVCVSAWTMQFMKHVLPRLIKPRKPGGHTQSFVFTDMESYTHSHTHTFTNTCARTIYVYWFCNFTATYCDIMPFNTLNGPISALFWN